MQANTYLLLASLLSLSCISAYAETQYDPSNEEASEELLEFLGQWENVDGEWIDPTQLQEISMLDQQSMKGDTNDQ